MAVLVFTVPERLAAMTVVTGPCVPAPGGKRLVAGEGRGRLFVCPTGFRTAMAEARDLLDELAGQDEQRGAPARSDREDSAFLTRYVAFDRAWLATGAWPWAVSGTSHRLHRLHWAQVARDRRQPLYVWHGPRVAEYDAVAAADT